MKRAIDMTLLWFSQEGWTKDKKQILIGTIVSAEQTKDRGRSAMHCSTTGVQQDYDATGILYDVGSVYERLSKLTSIRKPQFCRWNSDLGRFCVCEDNRDYHNLDCLTVN